MIKLLLFSYYTCYFSFSFCETGNTFFSLNGSRLAQKKKIKQKQTTFGAGKPAQLLRAHYSLHPHQLSQNHLCSSTRGFHSLSDIPGYVHVICAGAYTCVCTCRSWGMASGFPCFCLISLSQNLLNLELIFFCYVGSQEGSVIFSSPCPKSTGVAGALLILVCFSFSFWTIARFSHTWSFSYG